MTLNNKRILVTGGAGVIGRELLLCLKDGAPESRVLAVDKVAPNFELPDNVEFLHLDLAKSSLEAVEEFSPHVIFHLAASFERSKESPEFWEVNWYDNTLLSHKMVDISRRFKELKTFVFASSYLIYDQSLYLKNSTDHAPVYLKESSPILPRNITGASKLYTERELDFIKEYVVPGVDIINARIFRVYGCDSKDIISRWIRDALGNECEIEVFNGQNVFDYIYAGDVAQGLYRLANVKKGFSGVVNLGSGSGRRVFDVIDEIKGHFVCKITDRGTVMDTEMSVADVALLKKLTGWSPEITLKEGMKKVIEYETAKSTQ